MEGLYIGIITFSVLLSGLVSSFEMVYIRKSPLFSIFEKHLHDRTGILATVLFWNTFALVLGTVHIYKLLHLLKIPYDILISGFGGAFIFTIFGDLIPKVLAVIWTENMFKVLVYPFMFLYLILRTLGITNLASKILTSKYSRQEVLDFLISNLKQYMDESDINFIRSVAEHLHKPAKNYVVIGLNGTDFVVDENLLCLDVLSFMRKRGITRVRVGNVGVFDLHEFIKTIVKSHL
ncbi:MAG: DUF21 domain-containing protein [candidate division WOR-3 bacterium]